LSNMFSQNCSRFKVLELPNWNFRLPPYVFQWSAMLKV
jgi:hypothetical protein